MSLQELDARVDAVRAEAAAVANNFREHRDFINNSPNLTQAGKDAELGPLKDSRNAKMRELYAKEKQIVDDAVRSLQRRVYGTVGSSPEAVISFRDAQERAERLDSQDSALNAMRRALVSNDSGLAQAILVHSLDKGWRRVVDEYAESNPSIAESLNDLAQLTAWRNDSNQRLASAMHYMEL